MLSLTNKTALVTGGGSGIGRAISTLFAKQGASVYILDLDEKGATQTMEEIKAAGGNAGFISCNVSDQQAVKAAVA